jgi:hypothetical protein
VLVIPASKSDGRPCVEVRDADVLVAGEERERVAGDEPGAAGDGANLGQRSSDVTGSRSWC